MSENISLGLAFAIGFILFFVSGKFKLRNYLGTIFYGWFKNVPSFTIHAVAFCANFLVIMGIGIANYYINQVWFTLTLLPIGIVFVLNVTTSLIAVANAVKIESKRIKPTSKKKPNRVKKGVK